MAILRLWLMAAALLGGNPHSATEDADLAASSFEEVRPCLAQLAVGQELLDSRELRFTLAEKREFGNDLDLLRARRMVLQAAPRIEAARSFPPRKELNDLLVKNYMLQKDLAADPNALARDPAKEQLLFELQRRYAILDAARDGNCEFYYVTVRRGALARLKSLIPAEDFAAGRLPSPIP